jgi:predicted phosphodiesterase
MKHLVISDIHGRPLEELEDIFGEVDSLICLADFDHPRNIEEFMDLQENFEKEDKEVIIVPGNHDHAIFYKFPIWSGTLHSNGWDINGLHHELHTNYPRAKEFMKGLLEEDNEERKTHGVETQLFGLPSYIVHAGLSGSLDSCRGCPETWQDLWFRIEYIHNYGDNFEAMDKKDYALLIRGHDHCRAYSYQDEQGKTESVFLSKGGTFDLADGKKHVINPGPWFNGNYLIIDEDARKLEFKNAGEWE